MGFSDGPPLPLTPPRVPLALARCKRSRCLLGGLVLALPDVRCVRAVVGLGREPSITFTETCSAFSFDGNLQKKDGKVG